MHRYVPKIGLDADTSCENPVVSRKVYPDLGAAGRHTQRLGTATSE